LADVAMSAGYYDQSHLTRDFAALAGMTPGAYAADATEIPEVRFLQDPEELAHA
jgi:AraC-like DNA-binding protein